MVSGRMMEAGRGPTPRQLTLLRTIAEFQESHCYSPTIGELACESGTSRSTAFEHIEQLRRKGLLAGSAGRARSLSLTDAAFALLDRAAGGLSDEVTEAEGVPLVGVVAAGRPIEAVENTESLSLASCFGTSRGDAFALEVRGDSMIGEDIREGDYVICRRSATAETGELVVAAVDDGEATVKRFYREGRRVRLEAANGAYEPIYSTRCRIEGVVVGLVRRL